MSEHRERDRSLRIRVVELGKRQILKLEKEMEEEEERTVSTISKSKAGGTLDKRLFVAEVSDKVKKLRKSFVEKVKQQRVVETKANYRNRFQLNSSGSLLQSEEVLDTCQRNEDLANF